MGCSCKNTGARKQVTQLKKKTVSAPPTHSVSESTPKVTKKQIIIRRPAR